MTNVADMAVLDRPFYFVVVLWGERFRNYWLEYCLPSLLSPGNISSLSTRQTSKFVIATRPEDWAAMKATAIFHRMGRHVEPVFVEIPACPPGKNVYIHMGIGHKLALDLAYQAKAYAMVVTPDCIVSEGTIARLQDLARNGTELVLAAALRFGEEPFLARLESLGVLAGKSRRDSGEPLVISGSQMVLAAVDGGLHSETLSYEWGAPYFVPIAPAAWWRVPGEDGIILHSLSWASMFLDYAALGEHDTSTLDQWTLDGDYLHKNLGPGRKIHVVDDSDEMFLASWGPVEQYRCQPYWPFTLPLLGPLMKRLQFRASFYGPMFDPLKRRIFFLPVRWHARPLTAGWDRVERQAARSLHGWLHPVVGVAFKIVLLPLRLIAFVVEIWRLRAGIASRFVQLLRGQPGVWLWISWRARAMACKAVGIRFNAPRPPLPPH